jgi:hypothetical protein
VPGAGNLATIGYLHRVSDPPAAAAIRGTRATAAGSLRRASFIYAQGAVMAKPRRCTTNGTTDRRTITVAVVGGAVSGFFRAVIAWLLDQLQ